MRHSFFFLLTRSFCSLRRSLFGGFLDNTKSPFAREQKNKMNDETMRNELSTIQMQINQTTNEVSIGKSVLVFILVDESKYISEVQRRREKRKAPAGGIRLFQCKDKRKRKSLKILFNYLLYAMFLYKYMYTSVYLPVVLNRFSPFFLFLMCTVKHKIFLENNYDNDKFCIS